MDGRIGWVGSKGFECPDNGSARKATVLEVFISDLACEYKGNGPVGVWYILDGLYHKGGQTAYLLIQGGESREAACGADLVHGLS